MIGRERLGTTRGRGADLSANKERVGKMGENIGVRSRKQPRLLDKLGMTFITSNIKNATRHMTKRPFSHQLVSDE